MPSGGSLLPWILGGIAIAVLGLVAMLVKVLGAARRAAAVKPDATIETAGRVSKAMKVPTAPPPPKSPFTLPKLAAPAWLAKLLPRRRISPIRRSFSVAAAQLAEQAPDREQRIMIPLFLALGEGGAGKSTALSHVGLPMPFGPPPAEDAADPAARAGCRWWMFDRGVVLEVEGDLALRADGAGHAKAPWRTMLTQLRRLRPERPLDGVVLTLPATDLIGPTRLGREAMFEKASRLADRLWEIQRALAVRVPVYVLVTKCDQIVGFKSFCDTIPERLRYDIFGWSSPYALDAAFGLEWVDEAFDALRGGLYEAQSELFAERGQVNDADALFVFPSEFEALVDPLRDCVGKLFRQTVYSEGFFFRGLYFTGDRLADAADPAAAALAAAVQSTADESAADAAAAPVAPEREPVFLANLFGDKIFTEFGLVRPAVRNFRATNRAVLLAQAAVLALVVGGGLGLLAAADGVRIGGWTVSEGLRAEERAVRPTLGAIANDLEEVQRARRPQGATARGNDPTSLRQDVVVSRLLGDMAEVGSQRLWSTFIPTSWLSAQHEDLNSSMAHAFHAIVLPVLRERLLERTARLVEPHAAALGGMPNAVPDALPALSTATSDAVALERYLVDLRVLGANLDRYNRLAAGSGTSADGDFDALAGLVAYLYGGRVRRGLSDRHGFYREHLGNIPIASIEGTVWYREAALARAGELTHRSYDTLLRRLLAPADAGDTLGASAPRADLDAIRRLRAFLDTGSPARAAAAAIPDSFFFGAGLAAQLTDSIDRYAAELTGQLAMAGNGARVATGPIVSALDSLMRQPFMQQGEERRIVPALVPGTRLMWDAARLDEALALEGEYTRWTAKGLAALPPALRERVTRLAAAQLAARMAETVALAQGFQPAASREAWGERDVRAQLAGFEPAAERILRLLDVFDRLGAVDAYADLSEVSAAQAAQLLAAVDRLFDADGRYGVSIARWDGRGSVSTALFGARDAQELEDYLGEQREALKVAAQFARPLVTFVQGAADRGAPVPGALASQWDGLVRALDAYEAKRPGSSLLAYERLVKDELDAVTTRSCEKASGAGAGRGATGADFFARRRAALRRELYSRCAEVSGEETAAAYLRLASEFDRRLAGRFPFSDSTGAGGATPADLVEFFRGFDAFAESYRETLPYATPLGGGAARARNFVDQLARSRAFLAPFLDSAAAGRVPGYDWSVEFRVSREREVEGNQVAAWTLRVGEARATHASAAAARRGRWQYGDATTLALRWAAGSSFTPADAAGAPRADRTYELTDDSDWSLLRLLRRYAASGGESAGPGTIRVAVETVPSGASAASAAASATTSRVYVRIRLFHPDTRGELVLPAFPTASPAMTR